MEIEAISQNGARPPGVSNGVTELSGVASPRRLERVAMAASEAERGRSGDTLELSERARELLRARQAVENAPDVRADKVAAIRQRLAEGTYDVSPEQLARKLLGKTR